MTRHPFPLTRIAAVTLAVAAANLVTPAAATGSACLGGQADVTLGSKSVNAGLPLSQLNLVHGQRWVDLLTGDELPARVGPMEVSPYQTLWLANQPTDQEMFPQIEYSFV